VWPLPNTQNQQTMFKHILASGGDNINWMAIFSLITFFAMFTISIIAVWGKSKAYVQHMEELPLDEESKN
jgi:hypothetical protein